MADGDAHVDPHPCPRAEVVERYVRGELSEVGASVVLHHADECLSCQEMIARLLRDQPSDVAVPVARQPEERALVAALKLRGRDLSGEILGGKYRLVRRLGAGGMGTVYEAVNEWTERRVAVKLMHPSFSLNEETVRRFMHEAKNATRVAHPSIVDVLDLGQDPRDGSLYIVQELLAGQTLREHLKQKGRLSLEEAAAILLPLLDALGAAHDVGVVHRDVKPENIVLAKDRGGEVVPKLIDFGISKFTHGAAPSQTGQPIGTPLYMSPEQLRASETTDGRADVWAVGVMLFELLAGSRPFEAPSPSEVVAAILTSDAPPLRDRAPDVPAAAAAVVARALMRDRDDRYASVLAMREALAGCAKASGLHRAPRAESARDPGATTPSTEAPVSRRRARLRWVPWIGAGLALVTFGLWALRGAPRQGIVLAEPVTTTSPPAQEAPVTAPPREANAAAIGVGNATERALAIAHVIHARSHKDPPTLARKVVRGAPQSTPGEPRGTADALERAPIPPLSPTSSSPQRPKIPILPP